MTLSRRPAFPTSAHAADLFPRGASIRRPWLALAAALCAGYLLTLPLKHTTALNNLCLYGSLLSLIVSGVRERLAWPRIGRSALFFVAYVGIVVAAIPLAGIDMANSWRRVHTGLFEQVYVFSFCLLYLRNGGARSLLVGALAAGFLLLTVATAIALGTVVWLTPTDLPGTGFHLRAIAPGYGIHAQFFLPLLLGMLAVFPLRRWQLILAGAGAGAAFLLALAYNTTSGLALIVVYAVWLGWRLLGARRLPGRYFLLAGACAAMVALSLAPGRAGLDKIVRQPALWATGQHYQLLSNRIGIWDIALDCVGDAPWHGYGYGQKKIALVCGNEKYRQAAHARNNPMADYFRPEHYGSIGFHNQYLENWFSGGWVGALCWLAFFIGAIRSAWRAPDPDGWQRVIVLPSLLIFLAACSFNGLWEAQPLAKGLMVMLALALSRDESAQGAAA